MKKNYIFIAFLFSICVMNAQDIDLEAKTIRNTMTTSVAEFPGKFVVANDSLTNSLKLKIDATGEVNWYLDKQEFFIRDGAFIPYPDESMTPETYDFIKIDGKYGRIGFNILSDRASDTLTSSIHLNGTISTRVRTLDGTDNYDLLQDDHTIIVNLDDTAVTLTLPAASSCKGRQYKIKRDAEAGNNARLTLDTSDGGDIDEHPTYIVANNLGVCEVVSDGTQWWIMSIEEKLTVKTISVDTVLANETGLVEVNLTSDTTSPLVVTLPAAADHTGETFQIKRNADGVIPTSKLVHVKPTGSENLDSFTNASPYVMTNDFETVTITSNGSRWLILNNYNH